MTKPLIFCSLLALVACDSKTECDGSDTADTDCEEGDDFVGNGGGGGSPDADDDGDGFTNAEEEAAGTNPNYEYSRPYTGEYNVGFCDTPPEPTGATGTASMVYEGQTYEWPTLALGDVPPNFALMDQHGEQVDLYSFCGKNVMITMSAGWCGPCRSFAEEMQGIQDTYRDQNVQILEIITADNSNAQPDLAFLQGWASDYGFSDIPVLQVNPIDADGDGYADSYDHPNYWFDNDGYIPSIYHLGPDLSVISADGGVHDPGSFL